jgi:hypothetical protein|tara:strand:+ start:1633 stop:2268 length:636 start_codon:yes stop_codon:yes gene_type:complete
MKKFNTLYGGPPIIRDDSSPNGFTTTDPGEEKLFESILDKYKKKPIKPFNQYDKSTYPYNQVDSLNNWEMLQEDAKLERKRGNYGPTRELKEIEKRHNLSMQKQRYEDFRKKQREKNKKKPVADNFTVDTTGMKEVVDYKKKNGTLDGIFREPLKQDTMFGEPETFNMTVDEFIKQKNLQPQQEFGIGSVDKPTETTKTAIQLLKMFREIG